MGTKYADIIGHFSEPVSWPIFPTAHTPRHLSTSIIIKKYISIYGQ